MTTIAERASSLESEFSGTLLQPEDAAYDEARRVHNGLIDKRPALIARCRGVADVADACSSRASAASRSRCAAAATTSPAAPPPMAG